MSVDEESLKKLLDRKLIRVDFDPLALELEFEGGWVLTIVGPDVEMSGG